MFAQILVFKCSFRCISYFSSLIQTRTPPTSRCHCTGTNNTFARKCKWPTMPIFSKVIASVQTKMWNNYSTSSPGSLFFPCPGAGEGGEEESPWNEVMNYLPLLDQKPPRHVPSPLDFCSDSCDCSYLLEPPKRTLPSAWENRILLMELCCLLGYLMLWKP